MKRFLCLFSVIIISMAAVSPVYASVSSDVGTGAVLLAESSEANPIFSSINAIGDFIKHLFVPRDNYFQAKVNELNNKVNRKLGGLSYLYNLTKRFFSSLDDTRSGISFQLPKNYFFKGYSGYKESFLSSDGTAGPYMKVVHGFLTVSVVLITCFICYRKLVKIFER